MDFYLGVAALTIAYAAAGLTHSWFLRRLKLLNLSAGAIAGTAGYAFALVSRATNEIWLAISVALLASTTAGVLFALLLRRLRELEFAIASFAVQIVWVGVVANSADWLGGPLGISGVTVAPWSATLGAAAAAFAFSILLLIAVLIGGLYERNTPMPAAAAVVARSIELADTLGIPALAVIAIVGAAFGAAMGGFGIFLATYTSFVGIQIFSVELSITLLALSFAAVGGPISALVAAAVLIAGPEMFRLIGYPDSSLGFIRTALVGATILFCVPTILRPFLYENRNER